MKFVLRICILFLVSALLAELSSDERSLLEWFINEESPQKSNKEFTRPFREGFSYGNHRYMETPSVDFLAEDEYDSSLSKIMSGKEPNTKAAGMKAIQESAKVRNRLKKIHVIAGKALVIGNGAYEQGKLFNPSHDAEGMHKALEDLGFNVWRRMNASGPEMRNAVRDLSDKLQENEVGIVFFSGHGVQVRGQNYLLPIHDRIKLKGEVEQNGINVDWIVSELQAAKNHANVVILDACRSNPFKNEWETSVDGLAEVGSVGKEVLIVTSASPGQVAFDGSPGDRSPFTQALLRYIRDEDLEINELFRKVSEEVIGKTAGAQVPRLSLSALPNVYLVQSEPMRRIQNIRNAYEAIKTVEYTMDELRGRRIKAILLSETYRKIVDTETNLHREYTWIKDEKRSIPPIDAEWLREEKESMRRCLRRYLIDDAICNKSHLIVPMVERQAKEKNELLRAAYWRVLGYITSLKDERLQGRYSTTTEEVVAEVFFAIRDELLTIVEEKEWKEVESALEHEIDKAYETRGWGRILPQAEIEVLRIVSTETWEQVVTRVEQQVSDAGRVAMYYALDQFKGIWDLPKEAGEREASSPEVAIS